MNCKRILFLLAMVLHFLSCRQEGIVILGKTYYDAVEIVTDPPQVADHSYEVVWARNVGVVRRVMVDGTSWALIR
jgi:hypothetical protein